MRRLPTTALTLVLIVHIAVPGAVAAEDKSLAESFIEGMGGLLFAAAWPSATFERMKIGRVAPLGGGGWNASLVLYGTSAWDNPLHVSLDLTPRNGEIESLKWGKHNGVVPPGFLWATAEELLKELNTEAEATRSALSPTATGTQTWTIADGCSDGGGLRVRFFDKTSQDRRWT